MIVRSMQSGRLARQISLWIAVAVLVGAPVEGNSQSKESDPFQAALDGLWSRLESLSKDSNSFLYRVNVKNLVLITVEHEVLTYSPPELHVPYSNKPTTITWTSWKGPFTLKTLKVSPFTDVEIHSVKKDGAWVATATIPPNTQRGTYRYAVALASGDKVYVDPDCPPIIIEGVITNP